MENEPNNTHIPHTSTCVKLQFLSRIPPISCLILPFVDADEDLMLSANISSCVSPIPIGIDISIPLKFKLRVPWPNFCTLHCALLTTMCRFPWLCMRLHAFVYMLNMMIEICFSLIIDKSDYCLITLWCRSRLFYLILRIHHQNLQSVWMSGLIDCFFFLKK